VVDSEHRDPAILVVELVDHSVRASTSRPETLEVASKPVTDPLRIVSKRADHELDDGSGRLLG